MSRPRLLAITHDYTLTGAPIVLFDLITQLGQSFDILVASASVGPLQRDYIAAGFHAIVVPQLLHESPITQALMLSYDVLLANSILAFATIYGAEHAGKPALWYLHENQLANTIIAQAGHAAEQAFSLASHVVVPSEASRRFYSPRRAEIELIPYGVAERSAPPSSRQTPPLKILLLGLIEPRKGQDIGAAAISLLNDPNIQLQMVGYAADPSFGQALRSQFAAVLNIRFAPGVQRRVAAAVIDDCDILIVPSRDEVTPMVILEAMAAGKTVIASNVGGVGEMLVDGESGFLFPSEDVAALAALLRRCADDAGLRARVGENARRFTSAHRTLRRQADAFKNLILPLLHP